MSKTETKNEPKAFDFDELDIGAKADVPFELELVHPETRAGLGVFIAVVGSDGDTFQAYLREEDNRERRRAFDRRGKPDEPDTAEQREDRMLRALAACMKGWRTVIDGNSEAVIYWSGRKIEFSRDNAIKWMAKFRWVRGQINEATGNLQNFLGS